MWKHSLIAAAIAAVGVVVLASCLVLSERPDYQSPSGDYWDTAHTGLYGGCDGLGSCDACVQCSVHSGCRSEYDDCQLSDDCQAYENCLADCNDLPDDQYSSCLDDCTARYPTGRNIFYYLSVCVICETCIFSCDVDLSGCP